MKEKLNKLALFSVPLAVLLLAVYCTQKGNLQDLSVYVIVSVVYSVIYFLAQSKNKFLELLHRYRYIIAVIVFAFLVIFKFHGSSIGMWENYYGDSKVNTIYFGQVRDIRTDEWLVQTPLYLSQLTGENKLERINENIRSDGQNMVLSAYSPVRDITIIGKPFNWGFLFLDKERAFSWYWNFKLISLFMMSYEMSYILTKKNKKLSLLGACLITYAPACQWWFSTVVVDLIVFTQGIIVGTYNYLKNDNVRYKLLNLLLFICSGCGFVLSLYPAMQVPLGYLVLIFCLYFVWKYRDKIKKKDVFLIVSSIAIILGTVAYFIYTAKDSINLMLNTAYPGQRLETGGSFDFKLLSNYVFNWLMPYRNVSFSNPCELSGFISFLPLTIIMFFFRNREENDNKLKISIFIYILIMLSYVIIGYPAILAKITLFSFSPAFRMVIVLGFTSTYLFLMIIPDFIESKKMNNIVVAIIAIFVILFMFLPQYHTEVQYYMRKSGVITSIIIFTFLIFFALKGYVNQLLSFGMMFVLIGGFLVNPIARTLAPIYEKQTSKEISKINNENPGKWVALDNKIGGSLLYANGVQSFNGVHYYPDLNMWEKLDTDKEYEEIYNRYANVVVSLTTEKTKFILIHQDLIEINLNIRDLDKTGIKYILSDKELDDFNKNGIIFKELYSSKADNSYIYEYVNAEN